MRKIPLKNRVWIEKELPLLKADGVISDDIAGKIKTYYAQQTSSGLHWAIVAFAILGSLLIGSGIILLFAHNWEELDRPARAVLSFCPLVVGAVLSLAAVAKDGGTALRESAGVFHSIAVGAAIALIGQTYNIPSNMPNFFLSWSLLILPLMFLLRSNGAGLIYLALLCGWSGVSQEVAGHAAGFWLLILPAIIRLGGMLQTDRHSPQTLLFFWGVLITSLVSVGLTFERTLPGLWIIAYAALLSGVGLMGIILYGEQEGFRNPPKTLGIVGITLLAYIFTFTDAWYDIGWEHIRSGWNYRSWGIWLDGSVTLGLLVVWLTAAVKSFRHHSVETLALSAFPLISILCFILGSGLETSDTVNAVVFNGFMLLLGTSYIVLGCRDTKLRQLNGGMAVLSLLLVTRFFDSEFGFMARGIVFIALGSCFLFVNLIMVRRKKQKEAVA